MASEEEHPRTETTSNITSLRSDIDSLINSSDLIGNPARTVDKANNTVEMALPPVINCKCHEMLANLLGPAPKGNLSTVPEVCVEPEDLSSPIPSAIQPPLMQHECLCHSKRIGAAYALPVKSMKEEFGSPRPFWCRLLTKLAHKNRFETEDRTYQAKLAERQCPRHDKAYVSYETSEGIPKKEVFQDERPPRYQQEPRKKREEITERIDVYYFDHGNSAYYRTTDSPPVLATEKCAEKTDQAATRFWAEIFGTIHIGTAFVTAFVLQFLRFFLSSIARPLTVGILQMLADYFVKPFLSIVFNALIQPLLILLYNIATSFRDLCEPIAEAFGLFVREIANLCRAIRVVEVKQTREAIPTTCT